MQAPAALSVPAGLAGFCASFSYEGAAKHLVLGAKATGAHGWLPLMASMLYVPTRGFDDDVVVTWPTGSDAHRRIRGFDPAERIARAYARSHRLPAAALLERFGGPQVGRTLSERYELSFQAKPVTSRSTVVLIDDVVTSGASMSRAASALHTAGFGNVFGLSFARAGSD
jgi:predicted amidophosphoribosyltransferase